MTITKIRSSLHLDKASKENTIACELTEKGEKNK